MTVRVKICGITQYDDAKTAITMGADALGFIFYKKSPRNISPEAARSIICKLPPFITCVGVFVDATEEAIMTTAAASGINAVQLHGNESPELCGSIPFPVIKAFAVKSGFDIDELDCYPVNGYLLDTWSEAHAGGTGTTFDWTVAKNAALFHHNIILAGGLNTTNIEEALDMVRPYAVEFNSGVEIRPGKKNPVKMREAITLVKNWK